MKINPLNSVFYLGKFAQVRGVQQRNSAAEEPNPSTALNKEQLIHAQKQVIDLRKGLEDLDQLLRTAHNRRTSTFKPAKAASGSDLVLNNTGFIAVTIASTSGLGLDSPAPIPTVRQSTEEINTTPTSFSPFGPDWVGSGLSTALATIGGEYDGSNGTGTLTFIVGRGGTHGADNLRVNVKGPDGSDLEFIDVRKQHPLDTQYTLSNGLVFTLGAGDLVADDTFTADVFDAVGSSVNPDNPFNGTRNDDPNLDNGFNVTAGFFYVNGETITVNADDTINDVLDRITNSNAGVTATFDAATESVVLTQKTSGSAPTIVLTNDTSGFLAATKLDGSSPVPGTDEPTVSPLEDVQRFSSVQSGTMSVNGVGISIDVNADSFIDVINRINASGAGVEASFDDATQRVTIVSANPSEQLVLNNGGTGFFSAIEIEDGTYDPSSYELFLSEVSLFSSVQSGTVSVNGVGISIDVDTDTFTDVLNRINASEAGVTANFNAVTKRVSIVSADPKDQLILDSGDTGFFSAVQIEDRSYDPIEGTKEGISKRRTREIAEMVKDISEAINGFFDDSNFGSAPAEPLQQLRNEIQTAIWDIFGSHRSRLDTDFGINFDFRDTSKGI